LGTAIGGEPFRALELAVDDREVELDAGPIVERVSNDGLGNGAVEVLVRWIRQMMTLVLHRAEMRELLGNGDREALVTRALGGIHIIDRTQIARANRRRSNEKQTNTEILHFS